MAAAKTTSNKAPAKAKQPQDRKPAAEETTVELTANGRAWTIDRDALDDFELLDDFGEIETGNMSRLPQALKRLLGQTQYRDALESLRDKKTRRITVMAATEFFDELFDDDDEE